MYYSEVIDFISNYNDLIFFIKNPKTDAKSFLFF